MKPGSQYVVISPVRDEAAYIARTCESLIRQTILPHRWIVVDDGSTDGTSQLLDAYAREHPWITAVHRQNRGFRAAGGGVMDAFYAGYELVENEAWAFVVKLDGDLSFDADYFAKCFEMFDRDPKLGLGGGTVCSLEGQTLRVDSVGDPGFHVRGATKIYRRECWNQITPLVRAPGWDTLDEVRANYFGWRTRTFADLRLVQHKPTGSADGSWRNALKNGRANYLTGYHPLFMLGKCARRLVKAPLHKEWLGLMAGYVGCYVKRQPILADRNTIRYLRRQQLRRIFRRPSIYSNHPDSIN